ncbi:MAG: PASTA domain-containing protein [Clostridia bacterium]|nr:PASTA domain-containing protein [Clostridia bacterium]
MVSQDPQPGERVKQKRQVDLVISKGPRTVAVPGVVGLYRDEAERLLTEAGLRFREETAYAAEPRDTVVGQQPAEGQPLPEGGEVLLTVSLGPKPKPAFPLPGVVGMRVEEATRVLGDAGLRWENRQERTSYPEGVVAAQDPQPGSPVREGDAVRLTVSAGCARQSEVTVEVPAGPAPSVVRVEVLDAAGQRVIHEAEHSPGERFALPVCWSGDEGRVAVFVAGQRTAVHVLHGAAGGGAPTADGKGAAP